MHLKKYFGDKAFYRSLLAIALPIIVQNGITNFISMLDNIMVGQIGTEQMSGVSIVNQLLLVFYLTVFGAVSGAGIFGAQFFGKRDQEGVRYTFRFKLICVAVLTGAAYAIFLSLRDPLIRLYLHEGGETGDLELTLAYAKEYLSVALIGLIPYAVTQVYAGTLREIKHTLPPMYAGILGVAVNLTFNWLLIFGNCGFPALGVRGAAIATVISRFTECAAVVLWAHLNTRKCEFIRGAYHSFRIPKPLLKGILITGLPLILNETLWSAGQAMLLQGYSNRGIAVVSAMNITNTLSDTFSVIYLSMGTTISILLGHLLGAGKRDEARDAARKMLVFSVLMSLIAGGFIAVCSTFFPNIYNTTEEVRSLASTLLLIAACGAPIMAMMNACYFTLRSGGKTLLTFLFDSAYVWCVCVPLVSLLIHLTPLTAPEVFVCVYLADLGKCIVGLILVKKGIWVSNIVGGGNHGDNAGESTLSGEKDTPVNA